MPDAGAGPGQPPAAARPGRGRRGIVGWGLMKIAVQVGILGTILAAVGTVGFLQYSAQPSFCQRCHIMEPYYESWATSSHNQVPCISCHYPPGVKAEAMGKLQAANQVVKYVTGTYGTKPWAEVDDAACLRSGCHVGRKLEGEVVYKGIHFDHQQHLGELRRGKQLRCTSCHSQIVQGEHLTVTESTCFLCHFKDRPAGEPIAGCVGCHRAPPPIVSPAGFVVDHPAYVRDLASCVSCHRTLIEGSGAAAQDRCFGCHNEPERLRQFQDTTLMHRVHIAEHNVECAQCHTPIQHRIVSLAKTFELDCATCHRGVHDAQRRLYAGMGGHGTPEQPSAMYQASVACQGCHALSTGIRGHEQVQRAGEASCLSCHGIRYANILPSWQREMERRVRTVGAVVDGAAAALGKVALRQRAAADSLLRLARENVELVQLGKGAHNIAFADQLLRAAVALTREAVRAGALPYQVPDADLGPAVGDNICLQCHLGAERRSGSFRGRAFPHDAHTIRAGLGCTTCHTPLDRHGGTTLGGDAACQACHHREIQPMNCARCHAGPGGVPDTVIAAGGARFSHRPHRTANLACTQCHVPPAMRAGDVPCARCHENHHRPDVTCLDCHRDGVRDRHDRSVHSGCVACHGARVERITRWTRQVCTVCHTDRVTHNAPNPCQGCHAMPALDRGAHPDLPAAAGAAPAMPPRAGT